MLDPPPKCCSRSTVCGPAQRDAGQIDKMPAGSTKRQSPDQRNASPDQRNAGVSLIPKFALDLFLDTPTWKVLREILQNSKKKPRTPVNMINTFQKKLSLKSAPEFGAVPAEVERINLEEERLKIINISWKPSHIFLSAPHISQNRSCAPRWDCLW